MTGLHRIFITALLVVSIQTGLEQNTQAASACTYTWTAHRFRQVPVVTFERLGRFLAGVFPYRPDAYGETTTVDDYWLGPTLGHGIFVFHGFRKNEEPFTEVMVFRRNEPSPTLLGSVIVPGHEVDVIDIDGDMVPEILYPVNLDEVVKAQVFSLKDYPVVEVVLRFDPDSRRYVAGNEPFRHFLGARLEEAYAAMRRDRHEDRLHGLVSLAFYFFSTGQRESGRGFLEKHVADEKERGDIEAAFSTIIRVPWRPRCGCNKGWACLPTLGLCQPKGVAKSWADWPRVVDVEVVSASIAGETAGGSRRSFWDKDGSPVDPFVELTFDDGEILRTPVAEDNYTPTWAFKTLVTLYPFSTLKLTVKDKDRAFDQMIAMKTLQAPEIFKQADEDGLLKLKLRRVKELVLSFVERMPDQL